ncbi:uncharacterized protein CC84DRAFT_1243827 [Paraphaeosphaeria sporulosa]|uniref:Uncharacterized protein n=1 Tax=Paraphaeosphaeria sporulosa TaxID=1460663 RepID=A0A177CDW0_9PLEO|nr:uncharacterized protein CC84DRAFT_1243827 [Paraphaeosphaeria sporulosa]OAG05496.1 hypothetical protein CC84DRAFT_1243827 [Paraphaeosphaeria sporulosa]
MVGRRYMSLGPTRPGKRHNSWIWPMLGMIATSALGIALTIMNARDWRSSEHTANIVLANRSSIAVAVQILSSTLGFLQIHALCYTIASSFRVSQLIRAYSLDTLRFVDAISRPTVAWHGRWPLSLASVVFLGFSFVPAALWSGALTPVVAEKHVWRAIDIPTFMSSNYSDVEMFKARNNTASRRIDGYGTSPVWITSEGLFTFDLSLSSVSGTFQGLASASSNASHTDGVRPKFDSSGYRFNGRSYGAGASAGLIDIPDTSAPSWYTYYEVGLKTNTTCMRNQSAKFSIAYAETDDAHFRHEFTSNGTFANGVRVPDHYPMLAPQRQDIFIWAVGHAAPDMPAANKSLVSLAADTTTTADVWDFHQFNNVQCEVTYEATNFSVKVDVIEKTVKIADNGQVPTPEWANVVLQHLDDPFSRYSGNDRIVFGSQLGHSIVLNINQLRMLPEFKDDKSDRTLFQGLKDYIESLFDNGVGMLSATRLIGANQTVEVPALVGLPAVTYGKPAFVYVLLGINSVVLLVFLTEAMRTRFWTGMSNLQLADVGSVIVAASQGGNALALKANGRSKGNISEIMVQLIKTGDENREAIVLPEDAAGVRGDESTRGSNETVRLVPLPAQAYNDT